MEHKSSLPLKIQEFPSATVQHEKLFVNHVNEHIGFYVVSDLMLNK